jgi:limonene-1,2-epoxide hydrolase
MVEAFQGGGMSQRNRRAFLTAAGAAAAFGVVPVLHAATPTEAEQANIKAVTDFCAAWAGRDLDTIMAFFADNCAYRPTDDRDLIKGRDAVSATIKGFLPRVVRFEVLDTMAKGPMVVNERIDHFMPDAQMPLRSWRGVGVFFLKDRKIVEWQDYTISVQRA